jgi:hypothetical protein
LGSSALNLRAAAHELGHNFGLEHANLWRSRDNTPIGIGSTSEYGDDFDMMGQFGTAVKHFNASYKYKLGWLRDADIYNVPLSRIYTSTTYTINSLDASLTGQRAIKINALDGKNHWLEYRTLDTRASDGAIVHWESDGTNPVKSQLLDMTPGTPGGVTDAALAVGVAPFWDDANGVRITVSGKTAEALTVQVETNLSPKNCTYSFSPSTASVSHFGTSQRTTFVQTNSSLCQWSATSDSSWLTITTPATGIFDGRELIVSAAPNSGPERVGTIRLGSGQTFTVTQTSGTCLDSINPKTFNFPVGGETKSFSDCLANITVTSKPDWIEATRNTLSASSNLGGQARSDVVRVFVEDSNGLNGTVSLTVNQAGQNQTTPTPTPTPTPVITPTPTPTPVITPTPTPVTPTPSPSPTPILFKSRKKVRFF